MTDLKILLCPIDFSEPSDYALGYALSLAKKLDAKLHLLHVFRDPVYAVPLGYEIGAQTAGIIAGLRTQQQDRLSELAKSYQDSGVEVTATVADGMPYAAIVQGAKNLGASMIVMGTHGHTGVSRWLLGSVTERVVRMAPCPVLTVHAPGDEDQNGS